MHFFRANKSAGKFPVSLKLFINTFPWFMFSVQRNNQAIVDNVIKRKRKKYKQILQIILTCHFYSTRYLQTKRPRVLSLPGCSAHVAADGSVGWSTRQYMAFELAYLPCSFEYPPMMQSLSSRTAADKYFKPGRGKGCCNKVRFLESVSMRSTMPTPE